MPMTLNNVPQSSQTLSVTQPLIQGNFSTIDAAFKVDHVPYNLSNTGDQGKHNKVTFPVQGSAPSFNLGEVGLYNLNYATTGRNELFVTNASGGSFPMTATANALGTNGWSYLPSGIIIQWGFSAVTANAFAVITLPKPFATTNYSPLVTQFTFASLTTTPTISIGNNTVSNAQFTVNNAGGACNFYWHAIGI